MTKLGNTFIGTSGWKYRHWESNFYPADLKKKDQFNYFSEYFSTVELNNSFYRQPSAANFNQWYLLSPKNFIYAVKANRYFTHLRNSMLKKMKFSTF